VAPRMEARGTCEYTVNLTAQFKAEGIEVMVLCVAGPMLDAIRQAGIRVETFTRLESPLFQFTEGRRFGEVLRGFKPQIVHLQTVRIARVLDVVRSKSNVPVVLTVHWRPAHKWRFRRLSRRVDGIIATSQAVREEIVNKCRVGKDKIRVIPNAIDMGRLEKARIRPIFANRVRVIGSIGPVEERRGQELFVRAAARLVRKGADRQFVVAGEGSEVPALRKLADELGLRSRLTFVGGFSRYEDILDAIDVAVQSSLVDVSGFSILEAMGHGRPVIAFNTGTACEMIEDGKTGRLVPKGDVAALAAAIEELTDQVQKARQMGERARERVAQKFDIRAIARQTRDFYTELLTT